MSASSDQRPTTLDQVLDDAWRLLVSGVNDRRHGFHLPVLATTDEDGAADARTVVLRAVDQERRTVACHSDARSPKLINLKERSWAAWVFYDAGARVQVRAAGPTTITAVQECAQAKVAWEHTTPSGRRCYLAPRSPSIPSDGPSANLPPELLTREPSLEESERGADHFRLVTTALVRLEWLRLRHDGHLRARFCWPGGDQVHATWLEP